MINKLIIYAIICFVGVISLSCEKNEDSNDKHTELVQIGTALTDKQAFEVTLYANDTLFEGYNKLYVSVKDVATEGQITDADISLKPIMDMIDMVHAAPVENPPMLANDEELFEGAVVFIMPSSGMMGWTLDVEVQTEGTTETAKLVLPVVPG